MLFHGIEIEPFGVTNIHDVVIKGNVMRATSEVGIEVIASSKQGSVGRISRLSFLSNDIEGVKPSDIASRGISINGANAGTGAGPADVGGVVDGVVVRGNHIDKFASTVIAFGMAGNGLYYDSRGGEVRNLDVSNNRFRDCGDTCVALFGSLGIAGRLPAGRSYHQCSC